MGDLKFDLMVRYLIGRSEPKMSGLIWRPKQHITADHETKWLASVDDEPERHLLATGLRMRRSEWWKQRPVFITGEDGKRICGEQRTKTDIIYGDEFSGEFETKEK